jgi:CRP-like cAMP-binding protein
MEDLYTFLRRFGELRDDDAALVSATCRERTYAKGELITRTGELQRDLLFVHDGIQMSYHEHDGKLHVIAFTYPPSFSGVPESFLHQVPSPYTLQALTASRCSAIARERLDEIFDRSHAVERIFRRAAEAMLTGLLVRHRELQAFSMEERFTAFAQRSPHLLRMVPHKYLASYLNIDPTNFSKLFNSVRI